MRHAAARPASRRASRGSAGRAAGPRAGPDRRPTTAAHAPRVRLQHRDGRPVRRTAARRRAEPRRAAADFADGQRLDRAKSPRGPPGRQAFQVTLSNQAVPVPCSTVPRSADRLRRRREFGRTCFQSNVPSPAEHGRQSASAARWLPTWMYQPACPRTSSALTQAGSRYCGAAADVDIALPRGDPGRLRPGGDHRLQAAPARMRMFGAPRARCWSSARSCCQPSGASPLPGSTSPLSSPLRAARKSGTARPPGCRSTRSTRPRLRRAFDGNHQRTAGRTAPATSGRRRAP